MSKENLIDLCDTFPRHQRDEFLGHVWSQTFGEWDVAASTDEAILRANEAQARAARIWAEYK